MSSSAPRAEAISPTAHYTAAVWARHGLSHPALVTPGGRLLFQVVRPSMAVSKALGGMTLEGFLLARHRLIDHLLEAAIRERGVSQVIEVACGLSPRGWRFAQRHGARLTYVEADLPQMAARKRRALAEIDPSSGADHRVVEIDALSDEGPQSLGALTASLDPGRGTAIITEGLLSYLDRESLDGLWRRTARALRGFPYGLYLSDVYLSGDNAGLVERGFLRVLSAFVRGQVEMHFANSAEALAALEVAGFTNATLHSPSEIADQLGPDPDGGRAVRVIEATASAERR